MQISFKVKSVECHGKGYIVKANGPGVELKLTTDKETADQYRTGSDYSAEVTLAPVVPVEGN